MEKTARSGLSASTSGFESRAARFLVTTAVAFGLATGFAVPAGAVNILVNGGFETGDLTGWTELLNSGFVGVQCPGPGSAVTGGNCSAFLGPVGSDGGLAQSFATTVGTQYFFSFRFLWDGGTPSDFTAFVNSNPVFNRVNPPAIGTFGTGTAAFVATGALSSIAFTFRDDPGFIFLDNVSVSVPEPGSAALLGLGLAGLAFVRRRRSR